MGQRISSVVAPSVRAVLLLLAMLGVVERGSARAADIPVTSLAQKISRTGGCSLQEAILSANRDLPEAVDKYNADGSEHTVVTGCVRGAGPDRIILPIGAVFWMSRIVDDMANPLGPTATPVITSDITIVANGSRLEWVGSPHARAFAVLGIAGILTIDAAYIKGFSAKGGDGGHGGGGGMGAGGAVYVKDGRLVVLDSTFERNGAIGGKGGHKNGSVVSGGGGGGLGGGNGGASGPCDDQNICVAGGGGGGSRGNGGDGRRNGYAGGGGGGTLTNGGNSYYYDIGVGGRACGGNGGDFGSDAHDATCAGGGGGGGGWADDPVFKNQSTRGGAGNYGGGGGGGGHTANYSGYRGGHGGFGGGGGAASFDNWWGANGGHGGFGGGGESGDEGVTNDGPGPGGLFGGEAGFLSGGGGAGLGGAIFSDGGSVHIENSTFASNYAVRGLGGGVDFGNGSDAGGAIFAWGGATTIKNSTINRNETTGSAGGIVVLHPFVLTQGPPTFFTLQNTIVTNNGSMAQDGTVALSAKQCWVEGLVPIGSGNLIQDNEGCPGVVPGYTGDDPLLGPLQLNTPGITPTMAITTIASPAFNAADAATSLPTDQRGMERPKEGGFDIGAFEKCIEPNPEQYSGHCVRFASVLPPDPVMLTTLASPPAGGTVSPASGGQTPGSVVVITALPNPGYFFVNWTGNVGDPDSASTGVLMSGQQTVIANFSAAAGDLIAPTTTATPLPLPNANGWNNDDVTVGLGAVDNPGGSGVKQIVYSASGAEVIPGTIVPGHDASVPVTTDGMSVLTFFATDNVGNVELPHSLVIRLDKTPPTIVGAAAPAPNANGWNKGPVTVSFQCADALSGLAAGSPPAPTMLSGNGVGQSVPGTCTDVAGNPHPAIVQGINIDLTAPVVTPPPSQVVQTTSAAGAPVTYPPPTIVEVLSGLDSSSCLPASGTVFPVGVSTVSCVAKDRAGNTGAASFTITVNGSPNGRMFGVGFVNQGGQHQHFVFRAAQIRNQDYGRLEFWVNDSRRCGQDDLYDRDRSFDGDHDRDYGRDHHNPTKHFEATSMTVVFSDDPGSGLVPDPGPTIDTVRLSGAGKWNGRPGYTFEASASDKGEPGRRRDTFSFVVKDSRGNVVATVNGTLEEGNIQSTRLGSR